ncbi:Autophagy protein 5 [Smittium mucronatum]|uniref:Autophagy protein 5 n=1 Tax=Smittium mucronatum TaxID=133383 RepID=A0A1R0GMB0_9FUNG|nr:Autophagy protein 5 [Smittium mucronatum]
MSKGQVSQEIEKRIYESSIPIRLKLDPTDSIELTSTSTLPNHFQTFHLLGHRNTYFPFLFKKIKEQWLIPLLLLENNPDSPKFSFNSPDFGGELGIKEQDFWLEYNGIPLKWHYPIGLLYDIEILGKSPKIVIEKSSSNLDRAIEAHLSATKPQNEPKKYPSAPWDLVLHIRKYPNDKLIKSPSPELLKNMFMFSLKEADFIRHGSSKRIMELSKVDQIELLDGLSSHKMSAFILVRHLLGLYTSKLDWSLIQLSPIFKSEKIPINLPKAIPVRLYFNDVESFSEDRYIIYQAPISPILSIPPKNDIFGEPHSVEYKFTSLLDSIQSIISDNESISKLVGKTDESSAKQNSNIEDWSLNWDCITQGISISWEIPLLWISDNLSYPDSFLHLVLTRSRR